MSAAPVTTRGVASSGRTGRYVDCHCHIDYIMQKSGHKQSAGDLRQRMFPDEQLDGVVHVVCDPAGFSPSLGTWREFVEEDWVLGLAFGMHPHNAKYYDDAAEQRIRECLAAAANVSSFAKKRKAPLKVAWGEIGLDYHYNNSDPQVQRSVFERQLRCATGLKLPIVVHTREAEEDTYRIMTSTLPVDTKIHVHCFTDSPNFARKMLDHFPNCFFGFTGVITYKSATQAQDAVRTVPIDRLLLETDAPFMIPSNSKKRPSVAHPGCIPLVAKKVAELKNLNEDDVMNITRANAQRMYGI